MKKNLGKAQVRFTALVAQFLERLNENGTEDGWTEFYPRLGAEGGEQALHLADSSFHLPVHRMSAGISMYFRRVQASQHGHAKQIIR